MYLPLALPFLSGLIPLLLVAAQNFEYKISCILDKPTESMFGYISVLVSFTLSSGPVSWTNLT